MEVQKQQLSIVQPPEFIFKYRFNRQAPAQKVLEAENSIFMFDHFEYPESGGIFAYFKDVPFPAKGHPFPEAIYAVSLAKKLTRALLDNFSKRDLFLPFIGFILTSRRKKLRIISRLLASYREATDAALLPYYLLERYYSPLCVELRNFIITFLTALGIEEVIANNFAENFVILIQYDNAYYFRISDALVETNKELLLKNPQKEIKRLIEIVRQREPFHEGATFDKFAQGGAILGWFLYLPSIRRAFNKALRKCDFAKLQADEADKYHMLLWKDYNFMGKNLEERVKIYMNIHKDKMPMRVTYKANPQ